MNAVVHHNVTVHSFAAIFTCVHGSAMVVKNICNVPVGRLPKKCIEKRLFCICTPWGRNTDWENV